MLGLFFFMPYQRAFPLEFTRKIRMFKAGAIKVNLGLYNLIIMLWFVELAKKTKISQFYPNIFLLPLFF